MSEHDERARAKWAWNDEPPDGGMIGVLLEGVSLERTYVQFTGEGFYARLEAGEIISLERGTTEDDDGLIL